MVCDVCKDGDAVIQLTEIEGSGVRQLHLCEKCAAERGVETTISSAKPQINNFLQTIHEQMPGAKGEPGVAGEPGAPPERPLSTVKYRHVSPISFLTSGMCLSL